MKSVILKRWITSAMYLQQCEYPSIHRGRQRSKQMTLSRASLQLRPQFCLHHTLLPTYQMDTSNYKLSIVIWASIWHGCVMPEVHEIALWLAWNYTEVNCGSHKAAGLYEKCVYVEFLNGKLYFLSYRGGIYLWERKTKGRLKLFYHTSKYVTVI